MREVHVTGAVHDGTRLRDSMPMTERDWDLVDHVLGQIVAGRCALPWAVALEYGGVAPTYEWRSDPVVIQRDLSILAQRLHEAGLRAMEPSGSPIIPA